MKCVSSFSFDFEDLNESFYKLLKEEDFNFKTKNIGMKVSLGNTIEVKLEADSILDLKIGSNALIKSLEIIDKTLNI